VGYGNGNYERLSSVGLKQVAVQTSSPTRTALLAVGITAGLGAAFLAVGSGSGNEQIASVLIGDCTKPSDPACVGN
jgi:hypothetical protein